MPTIDGGFRTGDKVTPEDFNNSAPQGVICTVVVEDGRYTMKVEFPDGRQEWVHPYRWKKATIVAAPAAIYASEGGYWNNLRNLIEGE